MKILIVMFVFLGIIAGAVWWLQSVSKVEANDAQIQVKDIPADVPEFKRAYKVRINSSITMTVTLRSTSYGDRYDNSELDQNDGKWVLFDLHSPADKILDREILPIVQSRCKEIIALDRAYMHSSPDTFTDEHGHVWKRIK